MQLFNLGLPKSGTTTLQEALTRAGLKSAHWHVKDGNRYVGRSMYRNYLSGNDPLADFAGYDAITQPDVVWRRFSYWPQMDPVMLSAVRAHHPDCKFIMVTRSPQKILNSIAKWYDLRKRLNRLGAPGLPPGAARSDAAILKWIDNHYLNMRELFRDNPNFSEFDIESDDVAAGIGTLLGTDLPWWGRINAAPEPRQSSA